MTPKPGIPLNEPQTEAGRAFLNDITKWDGGYDAFLPRILAIEREARGIPPSEATETLRAWLLEQSRLAHEQANILPGDPLHAWDAGAAHMADATLTQLSTLAEDDHDINCGIDALRLGEDIGCTCGVEREARGIPLIGTCLLCDDDFDAPEDLNTIGSLEDGRPLRYGSGWAHAGCLKDDAASTVHNHGSYGCSDHCPAWDAETTPTTAGIRGQAVSEEELPFPIPDPWLHWHDPDIACDDTCPEWQGTETAPVND